MDAPKINTEGISFYPVFSYRFEDRLFINNEFVPSKSCRKFEVHNPTTEKVCALVYEADEEDVNTAVNAAKAAFPSWSNLDPLERGRYLEKWADELEKSLPEIAYFEALSMGKPAYPDRLGSMIIKIVRSFASKAVENLGESSTNTSNFVNISIRQPYGVCASITTWHLPVVTMAYTVSAALVTGNTIVLKSSSQAPLSSLVAARCARDAGIPPGVLNVLNGHGTPCGSALAHHMEIRKLAFTGSPSVGRLIQKASASSNFKKVTLELGGKNPLIIFKDADLAKAVPSAAMSVLLNSGQLCNSIEKIYVHEDIKGEFVESMKATMGIMGKCANPLAEGTRRGPQANKEQFERVLEYLQLAKQDGVEVELGGEREGSEGYFIEPTILTSVPETSKIMKEQILGPVVVINTFVDEDEVLERAKHSGGGLYTSVFLKDTSRALHIAKRLGTGSVAINCTSPTAPMDMHLGGSGREFGEYAIDCWTELKTVCIAL